MTTFMVEYDFITMANGRRAPMWMRGFDNREDAEAYALEVNGEVVEWVPVELINPEILERSKDEQVIMEGCLSVPGKQGEVSRPKKVKVKYYDRDMQEHIEDFDSFGAVVCQHEIDHLDGVLYTDKCLNLEDIPTEE